MRKLILTTAAVAAAIAGAFADETAFGTFTDTRDGQTYKTVKIGKQTWMAENLNYWMEEGRSWCYKYDTSYCSKYGRLYAWNVTMTVACPSGYHLPSRKEWDNLVKAVGGKRRITNMDFIYWEGAGKKLKSKKDWDNDRIGKNGNGSDGYGFSALPGGYRYSVNGFSNYLGYWPGNYDESGFSSADSVGYWWTTNESDDRSAYSRSIDLLYTDHVYESINSKNNGLSVRCVADTP
jgi:uncharacterized protein (TIGR02145 family)